MEVVNVRRRKAEKAKVRQLIPVWTQFNAWATKTLARLHLMHGCYQICDSCLWALLIISDGSSPQRAILDAILIGDKMDADFLTKNWSKDRKVLLFRKWSLFDAEKETRPFSGKRSIGQHALQAPVLDPPCKVARTKFCCCSHELLCNVEQDRNSSQQSKRLVWRKEFVES